MEQKYSKYLPSKKFIIITGSSFIILGFVFLISFLLSNKENFFVQNKNKTLTLEKKTINDFIQADTDLDSIPDWEEALWGTDKNKKMTFDDIPDALYIENKKKELNIEQEQNDKTLTETEQFAREFFTAYTALKASGEVSNETINNFSNALGQKIVNLDMENKYLEKDAKIKEENSVEKKLEYYDTIKDLFEKYREMGLGEELEIVNNSLITYESAKESPELEKLLSISKSYKDFAEAVMKINVPNSLLIYHLKIANNSYNLSISVSNMAKVINDPLVGLSGISQYQKYSDDLVSAVEDLENFLEIDLE